MQHSMHLRIDRDVYNIQNRAIPVARLKHNKNCQSHFFEALAFSLAGSHVNCSRIQQLTGA
jgi:hypothetical protein